MAHLYEYLWTKNNLLQTRCMYHKCPPVLIPDTILLKNKQPSAWYFSSLKTGSLQRRSKDLSVSKVVEALIRRQDPNTDIVATFVGSAQGTASPQIPCVAAQARVRACVRCSPCPQSERGLSRTPAAWLLSSVLLSSLAPCPALTLALRGPHLVDSVPGPPMHLQAMCSPSQSTSRQRALIISCRRRRRAGRNLACCSHLFIQRARATLSCACPGRPTIATWIRASISTS